MTYQDTVNALKTDLISFFAGYSIPDKTDEIVEEHAHHNSCTSNPNIVLFIYQIDDLFEEVKKITSIRAKGIFDKQGKPLFDQYAMTGDEKTTFNTFLKNATNDVYSLFSPYSKIIFPAYLYDEGSVIPAYDSLKTYVPGDRMKDAGIIYQCILLSLGNSPTGIDTATYWEVLPDYIDIKGKVIFVIDYDWFYKDNVIKLIETKIPQAFISNILAEWYRLVGLGEMYSSYKEEYLTLRDDIHGNLLNMKTTRRKYVDL